MKEISIGEVAKTAKISVRTLRHYDAIGLLKPSTRSDTGYRYYTEPDLILLHDILTYRALGISLNEILRLLSEPAAERVQILASQKAMIDQHIARLTSMKAELEKALIKEETAMSNKDTFEALKGFDPDQYEQETQEKWGDTQAYKISAKRAKNYTKADWARYKTEQDQLNQAMASLLREGVDAQSEEPANVAEALRLMIDQWFYPCSREMHAQLGDMYVMDERFAKTYEDICPGLAEYIKQAIQANLTRVLE